MEKMLIAEKYEALAESFDKAEANYNSSTHDTMFSEYPEMLDTKQLCQALGCSEKYVYKLIREGKLPKLNIYGNDYPTPDGTCLRDYIDIVDLAQAHVCAVSRMLDGKMKEAYEVFNIGTGKPVSVLELVNAFQKVNGVKLNYKFAPRRPGDVTEVWADPSKANAELGWEAKRTIEETLIAAWNWEKYLAKK